MELFCALKHAHASFAEKLYMLHVASGHLDGHKYYDDVSLMHVRLTNHTTMKRLAHHIALEIASGRFNEVLGPSASRAPIEWRTFGLPLVVDLRLWL